VVSKDLLKFLFASTIVVTIYSFSIEDGVYSDSIRLYAYLGLILSLVPVISYFYNKNRTDLFIFPIIFIHWLYFLRPLLSDEKIKYPGRVLLVESLPTISFVLFLSLTMLFIGYYYTFNKVHIKPLTPKETKYNAKTIGSISIALIILNIAFNSLLSIPVINIFLRSFSSLQIYLPTIIFALLIIYMLRGGNNKILLTIFIVYVVVQFFYFVGETLASKIILLFVGGAIAYVLETKKIPYKTIIIIALIFLPIYNSRFKYRTEAHNRWHGIQVNQKSFIDIVKIGTSITFDEVFGKDIEMDVVYEKRELKGEPEIDRVELVSHLSHCIYNHQIKGKPFKHGETFWWLPIAPIPRFLIPFKPMNIMATKVSEEYGLKVIGHNYAVNFPVWSEFYINFGLIGMIIFSFFQGMLIKYILSKLAFGHGDLNLIIVFTIIYPLIVIEGNITLMYGMVLSLMLLWWVIIKVSSKLLNG